MREVRTGMWHWEAPHPDWTQAAGWDQVVSSYAIDDGERLLLFDPLAVPSEIEARAAGRETAIVLTDPWHERDAHSLVARLGVPVYLPPPDEGGEDASWIREDGVEAHLYSAGDRLPVGVEAFPGIFPNDHVLWIESHGALVTGDTLIDRGDGLEFPVSWVPEAVTPEEVLEQLRPLLELPVEHVLAAHGGPFDRAALERALA